MGSSKGPLWALSRSATRKIIGKAVHVEAGDRIGTESKDGLVSLAPRYYVLYVRPKCSGCV